MKRNIFIILTLFLINFAFANVYDNPANLKEISNRMPKMGSIKCKFKQEKHLVNVQKPLVSGGDFEFIEGKGVYFYTKYPIQTETNYTSEKYKQINDIVNAISAKKYSKLEKEFSFYYEENQKNWTLGLKPKKATDAYNFISYVTIEGREYIEKITIAQKRGNSTTIWFAK